MGYSYSEPLLVSYSLSNAQATKQFPSFVYTADGTTSNCRIESVSGMVDSTPAVFTLNFGDATTAAKYGKFTATVGVANQTLPGKLVLNNPANYTINSTDTKAIVVAANAAANAAKDVTVVIAYW